MSFCKNTSCTHFNKDYRQYCAAFKLGWTEERIKKCPKRKRFIINSKRKKARAWHQNHKEWWNSYQRFNRHKHQKKPLLYKKVIGTKAIKGQIYVDCPFCNNKHRHRATDSFKMATCLKGFYKIKILQK